MKAPPSLVGPALHAGPSTRHTCLFIMGIAIMAILPFAGIARAAGETMMEKNLTSEDGDPPEIPEHVRVSIRMAQKSLKDQQLADGSWSGGTGNSSLATLALMVDGSVPGAGPYGREVAMAVRYLLSMQQPSGLIYKEKKARAVMYCHALATLVLAEAWGMSSEPQIRHGLKKAANLIVRTQNMEGGWRYNPRPDEADLSVTILQLVALRASLNAGISVPEKSIKDAVGYVKSCFVADTGGFAYQPTNPEVNIVRAGAGMLCLQMSGLYESMEVKRALDYIKNNSRESEGARWYFYGQYYLMQAMYQTRDSKAWNAWYRDACKGIIGRQDKKTGALGQISDTSLAILAMGLPYRYLPIYQR